MGGRKKSAKNKPQPKPEQKNRIPGFFTRLLNPYAKTIWVLLFSVFAISIGSLLFLPHLKGFFSSDHQQTTLFGSVNKSFILGDSTVDSGAYIFTSLPYGIDWPSRRGNDSLGRFSNGYTVPWQIFSLGLPLPVSFHKWVEEGRKNSQIGVNVASSGCGLLPTTRPPQAIECRSIDDQQLELEMALAKYGDSWFDKAVFVISVGGNDIMFSLGLKDPKSFGEELGSEMDLLLEDLHQLGGRNFFINNVGPVGCIPNMRALSVDKKSCFENMNEAARAYNSKVMKVSRSFKEKFNDTTTIVLADSYKLFEMILEDPMKYGFKNSDGPCCGNWSDSNRMYECKEGSMLCNETERMGYLFFDGAHTTAAANQLFTELCLEGDICYEV